MRDSIHKYFKIGAIQWMSHPPVNYNVIDSIRAFGCDDYFDALEVTRFTSTEEREQAKKMIKQAHMDVCYGAQPCILGSGLNPNDIDEAGRMKAEEALIKEVDEAEAVGANSVAFLAGKWNEETKNDAYNQLLKTTIAVCKYAASKGMNINLEVFDFNVDKAVLIGPAPYAAKFAAEVRKYVDNFGYIVDLSHFPLTFETSKFVVQTLKPYITHFHIGNAVINPNCEAYGDLHPRFGFPNSANDTAELLDFFRVLKSEGFLNATAPYNLSFEVKPWKDEDAELVIAGTKRVINRAWALLED